MATVLTIGGARFMGRFTVREFLERGDDVTLFTRGNSEIPFAESDVDHVEGDRRNEADLRAAYDAVDPDVVVDFAGFHPADVRAAVDIFADVDAYLFVSSTSAYRLSTAVPIREDETPLESCTPEQATDDSWESYGARKAECDRILFEAADDGVNAISVRPTAIYGPHDPTQRLDYWIDRVRRYDRIVVPGDEYWMPMHLGYAEDAARAITVLAEEGTPGEAYNVANREQCQFDRLIEHIATALETSVTIVRPSPRELATIDLFPKNFSLCRPFPYVVSTERLAALGWKSTPLEAGIETAVEHHLETEPDGSRHGPSRETEERLLELCAHGVRSIDGRGRDS
ncbi:NAD-dependent epimerase/dehydratase family protein [Natronorubrum halophilum]|uniref:NAD-dependent epimerase/dehydratase family protein n=1 Tax=Natronorubrum halophilum TaxID=1702106 RepID=UPI000EF6DB66|nr:NAD-dependent epimerase/dehydratase family protein [Natronorubrum halophilum]